MEDLQTYLLSVIPIFLVICWYRSRRPTKYPPGPLKLPLIGNLYNVAGSDLLQTFRDLRQRYGDVFSLYLGSHFVIVANGASTLREILTKNAEFTSDRPDISLFRIFKKRGIISTNGVTWHNQRNLISSKLQEPGFGKRTFEDTIQGEIVELIKYLGSNTDNVDLGSSLYASLSNTVLSLIIGRRFEYDDSELKYLTDRASENAKQFSIIGACDFLPFSEYLPGDMLGTQRFKKNAGQSMDFFRRKIAEHRRSFDEANLRDFIDIYLSEVRKHDDDDYKPYTEEHLNSLLFELFTAGNQTISTTLKWAILFLVKKVEAQKKMRREVLKVVGKDRLPSMDDRSQMPYSEAIILESLRLGNTVALGMPHVITEDFEFRGLTMPKDAILIPNLDSVMQDEYDFPDSNVFNPDRFIGTENKIVDDENVLVFSMGKRGCPGEELVRMELFLYLTSLVQRFEFCPADGRYSPSLKAKFGLNNSPADFKVKIKKL